MWVIGLKGWHAEALEESRLAKTTLPGNNAAHLGTIKATIPKSTYTLDDNIIDSPFTAAKFSEEITDGWNKMIALLLYGQDTKQTKEAAKIIIKHACDITGALNLCIKPFTATGKDVSDDGAGDKTQTAEPAHNSTQGRRDKRK